MWTTHWGTRCWRTTWRLRATWPTPWASGISATAAGTTHLPGTTRPQCRILGGPGSRSLSWLEPRRTPLDFRRSVDFCEWNNLFSYRLFILICSDFSCKILLRQCKVLYYYSYRPERLERNIKRQVLSLLRFYTDIKWVRTLNDWIS